MTRLEGKVALISGGARGQGAAEARLFVREGASVVIGDVLTAEGELLAQELGPSCRFCPLDVGEPDDWSAAVALAERTFGRVTVLVNNAGIVGPMGDLTQISKDSYLSTMRVNELGPFLGMQAVVPSMRAVGRGSIVNVSSTAGLIGYALTLPYVATKWAVRGMTKAAALDLAPLIRVNSVHPGPIDTPMIRQPGTDEADFQRNWAAVVPLGRAGAPDEVAQAVLFLASDESSFITGTELVVDGGRTTGAPRPPVRIDD